MPSYHMPSTGSARSVGVRRINKTYTFADGTKINARSASEARRQAKKLDEAPTVGTFTAPVPGAGGGARPGGGAPAATTKATAGKPGSFTGTVPAGLRALQTLGKLGNATTWTTGQYVALGDASSAYWNGTAWVMGKAP